MRVNGKGSEVDLEAIRQAQRQLALPRSALSREELQRILQEIRRKLDYMNKYLKIDIDDQLEIPVVKIFERDTNRLIRQIPPDYLLELMKRIDQMLGILLSERV